MLSDAEKAVSRELKTLGDVSELQARLDALQAKFDYQKKQVWRPVARRGEVKCDY